MRIGAQLYTLRDYIKDLPGVAETFKKVKAIGYSNVQISGMGPVDPKEVAKIAKDLGLTISCTHMSWDAFLKDLDTVIETHKMWGCRHSAIGGLVGTYFTLDGLKQFVDELAPVAAKLAAAGLTFSYHNHHHELAKYDGKTWLARLYDTVDGKTLKGEIDTYWITAGGGDPIWWINKLAGREPLVHFKDMMILPNREVRMAPIGEGNLNWEGIIKACKAGGVEYALVEQDSCYDQNPFDALAQSYNNLKAMGLD
jgi:sugar phosphate isomerase/epimerase